MNDHRKILVVRKCRRSSSGQNTLSDYYLSTMTGIIAYEFELNIRKSSVRYLQEEIPVTVFDGASLLIYHPLY